MSSTFKRISANAIRTVTFRRTEESDFEPGILLDGGSGKLVTLSGEVPEEVWNYYEADLYANITLDFFRGSVQITCTPEELFGETPHTDSPDEEE